MKRDIEKRFLKLGWLCLFGLVVSMPFEVEAGREFQGIEETFEGSELDQTKWKINESQSGGSLKVIDGKLYLRGIGQNTVGISTKDKISGISNYIMEYDFYPIEPEKNGWGIGIWHERTEGGRYWGIGWDGNSFWLSSIFEGADPSLRSKVNLPADTWYHIAIKNNKDSASIKITNKVTGEEVANTNLPHDAGTPARISFFSAFGKDAGVLGGYFDNIEITPIKETESGNKE